MNEDANTLQSNVGSLEVLLVEGNSGDARLFAKHLEESRVKATLQHEEGLDAGLSTLRKERPDVLVVGLDLLDSEGIATIRAVAGAVPSVPIVALTGRDDLQGVLQAQKVGVAEHLQKGGLTPELVGRTLRWAVERSQMHAKLRQRDAWIRSITEGVGAGVFRAGPTGRIQYANKGLAKMLGFSGEEELVGLDLTTFYADPSERGRMLAAEGAGGAEIEFERQDGSVLVGLLSAEAAYNEGGAVLHYDGVIVEITERKEMRAQLRQQEEQLRSITENISDGIYRSVPGKGLIYANQAFAEMFGYDSVGEILEADPAELYADPDQREQLREISKTQGGFEATEVELCRKDETRFMGLLSGSVVRDEKGEVKYYDGAVTDITERKEAERALKRREELHRETLRNITDTVLIARDDGTLTYVCPNVGHVFGYDRQEAEDLGTVSALLGTDPAAEHDFNGAQEITNVEQSITDAEGNRHDLLVNIRRVSIQEGTVMYTCRDITDRKDAERELERQNDLFAKAQNLANVGAWEYDVLSGEHTWTEEVYRIYGVPTSFDPTVEEGIAHYHPDDRSTIREVFTRAVEEGEPYDVELRLIDEKGEQQWVRTRGVPQTSNGEVVRVRGSIQDITDRKERERRLEAVFNQTYQFTGLMRPDGTLIEANDTALEFGGLSEEDVLGTPIWDTYWFQTDTETRQRLRESVRRAAEGEFIRYEMEVQGAEENRIIDFSLRPIVDEKGEVTLLIPEGRDITKRKKKKRELAHQKALLEAQAEATIDGLLAVDGDRNVAFYNERFLDIWKIPKSVAEQDPIGEPLDSVLLDHVNDLLDAPEEFREKVEHLHDHPDAESRDLIQLADGRWLDRYSAPIVGENETHFGRLWVFRDVTDRRERERELRKRGRQLEQIRKNITDVVWISPADKTEIEFVSEAYEDIWGRPTESLDERPDSVVESIHPEDRERVRSALEIQQEAPEAYAETYRVVQPDGEVRWVRDRAAGVYDESGELERIIGVATDITEQKKYELELETLNTRLQLALGSTNTGIFDWDVETDEVIWDETSERLFGYEPGEFSSRYEGWADRVHPDDLPEAEAAIERAIETGSEYQTEFRVRRPDNTQRWIQARGVVKHDEEGRPVRMIGIHTDITDRKEREERLREAKEEAERMNRLKSTFLANISHEIRTPLTSILGFAEMIGKQVSGEEGTVPQYARLIEKSGRRLMDTLTGVLNLSKLEAGEMDLSTESIDLSEEVREVVEQFQPQARDEGIDLQVEAKTPAWAWADGGGLQIVLRNLVSNAIKYTKEGGQVWVRAYQEETGAVLEVEDTGIGMDPEIVPDLFEAFTQESEGIGRRYEGTGLGLAVTREAVDRMEGSIEVETEKGAGTCFTVRLPKAKEERT